MELGTPKPYLVWLLGTYFHISSTNGPSGFVRTGGRGGGEGRGAGGDLYLTLEGLGAEGLSGFRV